MQKYTPLSLAGGYHQRALMMRSSIEKFVQVNGGQVCTFDWPGDAPALLFAHGASFHARCWDAVIEQLPNRCIAIDLRGHGRSSAPQLPLHWRIFAEDVVAAAEHINGTPIIGIGHSLGGHAIVQAAALQPHLFSKLLLIDPVIFPQSAYGQKSDEPNPVLRRRSEFASIEEMKEKHGTRPPFSNWDKRVFDDYCRYGLLPRVDDNGFTLACAPSTEAAVYDAGVAIDADLTDMLPKIEMPALVIRSSRQQIDPRDFMASPTRTDLASLLPHGTDKVVEGSHFVPMESPANIAAWIAAVIQDH